MKPILDACCGSKMFWFDPQNPLTIFADTQNEDMLANDWHTFAIGVAA